MFLKKKLKQLLLFQPLILWILCMYNKKFIESDFKKKLHWPKNILLTKNPQFHSDFAEILAFLSTHGLTILTEFDENRNKILDFLLVVFFWSVYFF